MNKITQLMSLSFDEVDHLSILQDLYDEYQDGNKDLFLLARYFINGMDDLPTLKQKPYWDQNAFESQRKLFIDNHHKLVEIISTYYCLNDNEQLMQEFHPNDNLKKIWIEKDGKKNGVYREFYDNTQLALEAHYIDGLSHGRVKKWFHNGKVT